VVQKNNRFGSTFTTFYKNNKLDPTPLENAGPKKIKVYFFNIKYFILYIKYKE